MPIIDFHNHYYPPEYLDALGPSGSTLKITHDAEGNPRRSLSRRLQHHGPRASRHRLSPGQCWTSRAWTSRSSTLTTPGTHVETPAAAVKLASITNDAFARVRDERRCAVRAARDAAAVRPAGVDGRSCCAPCDELEAARRDAVQQRQRRRASTTERSGRIYEAANDRGRRDDDPPDLSGRRGERCASTG